MCGWGICLVELQQAILQKKFWKLNSILVQCEKRITVYYKFIINHFYDLALFKEKAIAET